VKDDAYGVTLSGSQSTHSVSKVHAIGSPRSVNRPMMHSESNRIALPQWYNLRTRLHPWPLFREYKFAALEITLRFRKQECNLDWKDMLSVKVLMQAVIVSWSVLQQKWRRPKLARFMATSNKVGMFARILNRDPHALIPAIGNRHQFA
jgi:hypothetical protein